MFARRVALALIFLLALSLSGCGFLRGAFGERVQDTPAPTAIPLSTREAVPGETPDATPTPREAMTPTAAPLPDLTPTAPPPAGTPTRAWTPTATAAEPTRASTRVVAPAEAIHLPPGFGISIFAEGLAGPRMLAVGPDNELYVANRGAGSVVRLPDDDRDGVANALEVVADGLSAPSSIAFLMDSTSPYDGALYVGETRRVLRLTEPDASGVFQERAVVVDGLPSGGHNTRTLLFSPDYRFLYVSVGSSCNVCIEEDPRRAGIVRYRPDGSEEMVFATGLRNAVGITFRPGTDELWATNNGRDWLGDDQPPETVHLVREWDDAGWPRCHAGRIVDPEYGEPEGCQGVAPPAVEMQAHSAPLGLTFYSGDQFPADYQGDLYVAFHGSWNRSDPTGYKVVRIEFGRGSSAEDGQPGVVHDFAAGWLREDGSRWGRPVDVIVGPDASLYVSDDEGGVIYRIFYHGADGG